MGIEVRPTEPDELRAASAATSISLLHSPMDDELWEKRKDGWMAFPSFSAWDGDRCVGHAGHFVVETVVPGGARLGTGAVTRVGVVPTHRRRGAASGLMKALVDDCVSRKLPLMSLRASEAVIYQRFGFGMAGDMLRVTVDSARARPVGGTDGATDGTVELVEPDEVVETVSSVYAKALGRRVGQITRPDFFWDRIYENAIKAKHGAFVAAHRRPDGVIDGFANYAIKWGSFDDDPTTGGLGSVFDLVAESDEVELALWRYLMDIDLIRSWSANCRPIDDPLREAVWDRRAYRVDAVIDEQWVRLVDVNAALTARSYNPVDVAITVGVTDPMVPANDGVWRIDRSGASRLESTADAELSVDIATVGAAYLGGVSWTSLAAAGQVVLTDPADDAAARADLLFRTDPAPYCGTFF